MSIELSSTPLDPVRKHVRVLEEMFPGLDPALIELLVIEQLQIQDQNESKTLDSLVQQCIMLSQQQDELTTTNEENEEKAEVQNEDDQKVGLSIAQSLLDQVSDEILQAERDSVVDIESIEPAVNALVKQLRAQTAKECRIAIKTLIHCLSRVLENPADATFRTLRLTNEVFKERVGRYPSAVSFLQIIGFKKDFSGEILTLGDHQYNEDVFSICLALLREELDRIESHAAVLQRAGKPLGSMTMEEFRADKKKKASISKRRTQTELRELHMERLRRVRQQNLVKLPPAKPTKTDRGGTSVIPDEEPPSIFPPGKREFNLRDIEELRKHDILQEAKKGTRSEFLDKLGQEALKWTNEFRKENGLNELHWHQGLADIGKVHSARMGTFKVPVGHDGFNERVKKYPFPYSSAAENVAMFNGIPVSEVPRKAVRGWINSP